LPRGLPFLVETLETVGRLRHRTDVFLQDDVLSRCRTDDVREPPQVGWAPMGPVRLADILSAQEGCETDLGIFESAERVCTRPGEGAAGFLFDLGDSDQGESAGASQAGQWHGVSAVGGEALPRFFGKQRGGHAPAGGALGEQIPLEPIATRPRFTDEEEVVGFDGIVRTRCSLSPGRVPMGPREITAAPDAGAPYATVMGSGWTSLPRKSVRDCAMVDLRVERCWGGSMRPWRW